VQSDQKSGAGIAASIGFPPVSRHDARVLVLGSLPGQRSLQATQYYAHAQNAFWRIMRDLTGAEGSYEERCGALVEHGIALWDVLAESVRPGSMDSDIQAKTAQANDFKLFFSAHPDIGRVCFNGQTAAKLFQRLVTVESGSSMEFLTLPSTSPAYAAMNYAEKLARWSSAVSGRNNL
jgi:TDG/mug DNA glycosylase family protein